MVSKKHINHKGYRIGLIYNCYNYEFISFALRSLEVQWEISNNIYIQIKCKTTVHRHSDIKLILTLIPLKEENKISKAK